MRMELHRTHFGPKSTLGELTIDGEYFCVTLEDRARPSSVKVQDETAIPPGTYKVIVNMSPRLGKLMPRLVDVPMFDGILIHSGNTDLDTKGCILVGHEVDGPDHIHGGSVTFPFLMQKIQSALDSGETVEIVIFNDGELYAD